MSYRDRDNVTPDPIPSSFRELGEAMASTLWLQKQLSLLERVPASNRVDSLRMVLKETLDLPLPTDSMIPVVKGSSTNSEVERLKSSLHDAQLEIVELKKQQDSLDLVSMTTPSSGSTKKLVVTVIVIIVLIMVVQYIHNS